MVERPHTRLDRLLRREDIKLPNEARTYMRRWSVPLPFGDKIAVHHFLRDDSARALHDHPWNFLSLMIWGRYYEITERPGVGFVETEYRAPCLLYRRATDRHRIVTRGYRAWTIVLMGRRRREWGFWPSGSWVEWYRYLGVKP